MSRPFSPSPADWEFLQSQDPIRRFWDRTVSKYQELEPEGFESDDDESCEVAEGEGERSDTLPRARTNVEAVMGLLAAFIIGLPAPLFATVGVMHLPLPNRELLMVLAGATFFATAYLCLTVVRVGGRAVEGDRFGNSFYLKRESQVAVALQRQEDEFFIPLSLAMAIRLPQWWVPIRPFIAVWWLCHFVVAAVFGHMLARGLNGINNAALITIPISLALTMAFLFAANLYLMLAIAVSIRMPRIWLIAWRYRFVVDLVVTLAMIATA